MPYNTLGLSRGLGEEGVLCSYLHPPGAELHHAELEEWGGTNHGSNDTDFAILAYHEMFLHLLYVHKTLSRDFKYLF